VLCLDESDQQIELTGQGFLVVGTALPTVTIGTLPLTPDSAEDCFPLAGPVDARSCETLLVTIEEDALVEGPHDIVVTNPETAACNSTETVRVEVVGSPVVTGIVEELVCGEQLDNDLTITGSDFLQLDGALPVVHIGGYHAEADAIGGSCTPLQVGTGQICDELSITVLAGDLDPGVLQVSVTNPPPANCTSDDDVQIENLLPPVVDELIPAEICTEAATTIVEVVGDRFLFWDVNSPTVEIGAFEYVPTAVAGTCAPLDGPFDGDICTSMEVEIPALRYTAVGPEAVLVTNPEPAACDSFDSDVDLEITPPPEITGVVPLKTCVGTSIEITGTGFTPQVEVTAGGRNLTVISVTSDNGTDTIVAEFPLDMEPGFYDITVTNPDDCGDVWGDDVGEPQVEVTKLPLVFFVDPEVVYAPVSIQAKVYVSGINTAYGDPSVGVLEVVLTDPSGVTHQVDSSDWLWSADEPNRLFVTLESGMDLGDWDVTVEDAAGCLSTLEAAFEVTADKDVVIETITPEFGWTDAYTPVVIESLPDVDLTPPEENFQDVPRLFLNPPAEASSAVATEVFAVTYQNPALLDAIVPDDLEPGLYDLLVINPDRSIGFEADFFEVTLDSPPIIESVAPGSVDSSEAAARIIIRGQHFPDTSTIDANWDAQVSFDCLDRVTGNTYPLVGPLDPVEAPSPTRLEVDLDATQFGNGAVCIVEVINRVNDTYDEFAAISVTNPSENLYAWTDGEPLVEARRAPAVVAGRVTRTARYVYAIGGDDGEGTVSSTIEWAKVGLLGGMEPWFLPYDPLDPNPYKTEVYLPEPRTMAGVSRIGRFVYLVGGNDGTGPVDTVLRAQILDPLTAPRIDDISVDVSDSDQTGLDGGTWIYRVAALYASDDDDNPGGESLPSDPFVVRLPDTFGTLDVEITWIAPSATAPVGYRVYRTPSAGSGSGSEVWITDVGNVTSWEDTGAAPQSGRPLPTGALGRWHVIDLPIDAAVDAENPRPREFPCVAEGMDPGNPGGGTDYAYIYLAGGLSEDATPQAVLRDDVQFLTVALVDEHDQDVQGWAEAENADGVVTLPEPVWQCHGHTALDTLHSLVGSGDTWVYFGGGFTDVGMTTFAGATLGALVGVTGLFDEWIDIKSDMPSYAGYGYAAANNQLYVFGGHQGGVSEKSISGAICGSTTNNDHKCSGATPNAPPEVQNWNSQTSPATGRYLPGSAQESSVIFLVGGAAIPPTGGLELASKSVEWNNY
ncbi:MAG: IPT/TIG domain-containing protein, partial [Deltaproteobacteria bacterium]|nr:IPT/TIG domain-containing protein [Deltaproteobacteria bacterium]